MRAIVRKVGTTQAHRLRGRDRVQQRTQQHLSVADRERVEKLRDRLRVRHARPAADDQRVALGAVAGEARDPRQVEEVGDVHVVELGLERDPDKVELARGVAALQSVEGDPGRPHRTSGRELAMW
jgi:hypothetical protein